MLHDVVIEAATPERLDAAQAALQERVDEDGRAVVALLRFKCSANGPCVCGSGRKWKRCCGPSEGEVHVTRRFWPTSAGRKPWKKERRRRSPVGAMLGMLGASFTC